MVDISFGAVTGKLNIIGHEALRQSHEQAKGFGNRNIELAHWINQILRLENTDLSLSIDHFKLDASKLTKDVMSVVEGFKQNQTEMPGISNSVYEALERGWHYATLFCGETQIRTGHILLGGLKTEELRRIFVGLSKEFEKIDADRLAAEYRSIWKGSQEDNLRPVDGSGLSATGAPGADTAAGKTGTTALDRFSVDLTAKAKASEMDPIVGRDEEIRQIIDVLMRRRQNNPILTGEAGVGKTAVVEGFAQRIASSDVPDVLKDVRLCALDIGLMQAGASMKGEFEQRLRSVIDEVQQSPVPTILFIDEAHTLIGAGGAEGTGDAANLLKPALARGTLRTVAATTWAEYRKYFEKDPALTRRFQPVAIDEPDTDRCCDMLRGIMSPMEDHHQVRISDAAIIAAVSLSDRYIPGRQLPDKAVSLLDTACARVAISQSTTPAAVEDLVARIAAREKERAALEKERDLGDENTQRIQEIDKELAELHQEKAGFDGKYSTERTIVEEIHQLQQLLDEEGADQDDIYAKLRDKAAELEGLDPSTRMIFPHVNDEAVASVVSDWTGIPVGRMVKDEVETILNLADTLNQRVIGQSHGLEMISKRIETNRARLDNPNKPIGVFMLCGPSGVGKTESALALAEALYGGEQNMITINMSEYQEAHTVSSLKGAPPGYVGYGEGGRLTEAVRRKPYSVVLLDEVEKAHPDVHEVFFQVFDKGQMEDGTGRMIDFKNTLIILTSNVGTDLIMQMSSDEQNTPYPEALGDALRPELLKVFPAALLGRIVTIPYYPLSDKMLGGIVRLQLDRIGKRITEHHGAKFNYTDEVVKHIVKLGNDPDSGGRMIDNIITNSILPAFSREILNRSIEKTEINSAELSIKDGVFSYKCT